MVVEIESRMTDFADELGPAYLNLVIRRLARRLASDGDRYFDRADLTIPAGATAIMAFVVCRNDVSVASIADALGYSHQAVTKTVDKLERAGLVKSGVTEADLRVRGVSATEKGSAEFAKLEAITERIRSVFSTIFDESGVDLFRAIRQFEKALDKASLFDRLIAEEGGADSSRLG
jgi:DNA-binding MarR family transcriptional regulator